MSVASLGEPNSASFVGLPHPIPYQGSKRKLAARILGYVPHEMGTFFEPFCGSAALSLAVARDRRVARIRLSDSFAPLAALWSKILAHPEGVADAYESLWREQSADPRAYFDLVRARFNEDGDPARLLYLLARCVKSAVRFNASGAFNQSADHRRLGTRPARMRQALADASRLLRGVADVRATDYAEALADATPRDVVYLDPPYQGTSGSRDRRYHAQLDMDRFVGDLEAFVKRRLRLIVSFDGRLGQRSYGQPLPERLGLVRLELRAGRSSQATLVGLAAETTESLYVSPSLLRQPRRSIVFVEPRSVTRAS